MTPSRRQLLLSSTALALAVLGGCAQIQPIATGETVVKNRLAVQVDKPWNQFPSNAQDPAPTWTQEGVTVDTLRFYVALKDGDLLAPTPTEPKGQQPLAFKAGMGTAEVVSLFESLYSRGGSTFVLDRVEPREFAGGPGFRIEFSSVRKVDEVRLKGVAWGTVRNNELTVITYTAPRLTFFDRHLGSAQAIAASARLR